MSDPVLIDCDGTTRAGRTRLERKCVRRMPLNHRCFAKGPSRWSPIHGAYHQLHGPGGLRRVWAAWTDAPGFVTWTYLPPRRIR